MYCSNTQAKSNYIGEKDDGIRVIRGRIGEGEGKERGRRGEGEGKEREGEGKERGRRGEGEGKEKEMLWYLEVSCS